ncbi:TfoX/Sxy family protein [Raoultibacter phocaeensis]|uniref:TfoX/Sxy family protein n=1 Tax=Raoultibacter phocaeensis TaxID=2479841 RepID=UPI00111A1D78|nr:TfoX/Sxy family protein [Raoultibacter phocaeensis]
MKLTDLPNIGPNAEKQLTEVGIATAEALVEAGAEQAWLQVKTIDPGVCLHMLYALEGAVEGIPKKELSPERKAELKAFFDAEK